MRAIAILVVMLPLTAQAAEPGLCRTYATKLLNTHMQWLWNRAYSGCLNMEIDNPTPPDNWEGAMRVLDPGMTPLMIDQDDVAAVMEGMPEPKPRPEPAPAAEPAPAKPGKSGFTPGSDQWKAWCRQNYPRSWDATTGTVILPTSRKRARSPCPG